MRLLYSKRLADSMSIAGARRKLDARILLPLVFLYFLLTACNGWAERILCRGGFGYFSSGFQTGVTVTVRATKHGGFAAHTCDATLRWSDGKLPAVQGAYQVDIDVLGADLGLGGPVVAFQSKKSDIDKLMTYQIYSLKKPPRLLRTITGGDYYNAQDYDLENRIAIWTDDAGAADGFENLPLSSFDFPPTVVLQFEKKRLIVVSAEYQPFYDHLIEKIRAQLTPAALAEFRKSDGKLSSVSSLPLGNMHTLLRTKIEVLEMVWAYLYSGREQEAWNELAKMWPSADLDRIRGVIQKAQAHGIIRQTDGIAAPSRHSHRKRHAMIYDMTTRERQVTDVSTMSTISGQIPTMQEAKNLPGVGEPNAFIEEIMPKPIYLASPEPNDKSLALPETRIYLKLVIDAAGKVQKAQLVNKTDSGPIGDTLIRASKQWNFIPGFRAGRPVPTQILFGVSPEQ